MAPSKEVLMPILGVIGCRCKRADREPLALAVRGKLRKPVSARSEGRDGDLAVIGRII